MAYAATALAFAPAAVSLLWTRGGTLLLDTLGGALVKPAREHSAEAFAVSAAVVVLKTTAELLALTLGG